jgi:pyruvate dehydrogenase E2 component (dihydrolipoamide acetyltransferase)
MPTDFTLPELGENVTAGDVVRVLVAVGDTVAKDQPVLELETDKATIEVPSSVAGTVKDVRIKQGDRIKVGQVVLTLDDNGGAAKGAKDAKEAKAPKETKSAPAAEKPKAQPEGAPEEGGLSQEASGGTDTAATGGAQKGAAERTRGTTDAAPDERFVEHAEAAGKADEGARKPRGEVVNIDRGARPSPVPARGPEQPAAFEGVVPPAAPSVRRLARELGVDIGQVRGRGRRFRTSASGERSSASR